MPAGQTSRTGLWSRDLTDRWGQASLSSLRSVGASLASGLKAGYDSLTVDSTDKELVTVVKFARLEYRTGSHHATRRVLLLGYQDGFQVWDLEDARLVRELASRRDGAVRFVKPTHEQRWYLPSACSAPLACMLRVWYVSSLCPLKCVWVVFCCNQSQHT